MNVKLKLVFADKICHTPKYNHQDTVLTKKLATTSTLQRDLTITNFFPSKSSMDPLTVKKISAKIHTEKNENVLRTFQQLHRGKDTTFKGLNLIESVINAHTLLD